MSDIISKLLDLMPGVKVPQKKHILILFATLSSFIGKANFRNLSRHSELCEHSYSRWSRREFDYPHFNRLLIEQELGISGEKVALIDASFLPKSGKCTSGLGMFWSGALGKAARGLELSTVAIADVASNTAYGLESRLTDGRDSALSRTEQYSQQVKDVKTDLDLLKVRYIVTDGYYSKHSFASAMQEMDLFQVGKLRQDASLYWRYEGEYSGRGRPRKYDGAAKTQGELKRWQYVEHLDDGSKLYEGIVWSTAVKEFVKVVIVRQEVDGRVGQALLFSTDLELPAVTIVAYYKLRFQIEFIFRDGKQHTGLGDCQALLAKAQYNAANASITTLNLLKIEDRQTSKTNQQTVISIESWKRRKANQQLMDLIFCRLEIDRTDKKVAAAYEDFSNFGCIAA